MLEHINDIGALATTAVLFLAYFIRSERRGRKAAYRSVQSLNRAVRDEWVHYTLADPSRGIVGVQTLRNSTMAATFFASTAVLLLIGTLNMTDQAERFSQLWGDVVVESAGREIVWTIKVLLLVADLFAAFFFFAMAVRFFNHVGYQISLPKAARPEWLSDDDIASIMNRGGRFYTIGMRAYFLAVPLVFWLFGPIFMLLAAVMTLIMMTVIERPLEKEKDKQVHG